MQRLSDEYFLFQLAQGVRGSRTENTSPQPVISKQPCVFIYVIVIRIILDALIESVFSIKSEAHPLPRTEERDRSL